MKIYTKTGDKGHTQVYLQDMQRRRKDDVLLEVYGTLDELNAHIGLAHSLYQDSVLDLPNIQHALFTMGFVLSANAKLTEQHVTAIEAKIDEMTEQLPPQTTFILPGGHTAAAQLHVARTVARRAERHLVHLSQDNDVPPAVLQYINRLSDYLFTAARWVNYQTQTQEVTV